ncbi:PREDICTED: poly(U)-specific endoribonuclease-C-like, partial [Calidris pugnax]|uniref:poly(U)-specific endoribonuclease-C-like n=1 Tax=Calidris pugnax TaxID=198806 RepID=UPI00071DDE5E
HPRLFSYVAEERLFSRPTFSRFLALLDNYEEATGHQETVTAQEMEEEEAFLDAVFQTPVMATLTSFFLDKGLYPSEETFRADLKQMWFGLYSRSGGKALDSSGFEHVFRVSPSALTPSGPPVPTSVPPSVCSAIAIRPSVCPPDAPPHPNSHP